MTDDIENNIKMSAEDQDLWDEFIQEKDQKQDDQDENFAELLEMMDIDEQQISRQPKQKIKPVAVEKEPQKNKIVNQPLQLDRQTSEKLRKGKMQIEACLDLHGKNQNQAYEQLNFFIEHSIRRGLRCVLVITGKGKSRVSNEEILALEKGILKQKVPEWLESEPFRQHILKTSLAHPKDGGSGALYIYLKRQR